MTGKLDVNALEDVIADDEVFHFVITEDFAGKRLDKVLTELCVDFSRSRIQGLIEKEAVQINGKICGTSSRKLEAQDIVEFVVPPLTESIPRPESIALDIVFEDEDMLVVNKPAGMVVHPGAGNYSGTLVNALLAHCGDSLSGIGGVARPGIVHRLDKDTSGLMVVAKSDRAHKGLAAQLETRTLGRIYRAIVFKIPFPPKGMVDQPLGRHLHHRLKMAVVRREGREARTHYQVLASFGEAAALVECKLDTGRTHQIRVHMEFLGHPLLGDALYGPQPTGLKSALGKSDYADKAIAEILAFPRQALHAYAISFEHPVSGEIMEFERDPPEDMTKLLKMLNK